MTCGRLGFVLVIIGSLSKKPFVIYCAAASDELRTHTGGCYVGFADVSYGKADGDCDSFKVHTDESASDVQPCVGGDVLDYGGGLHELISGCGKGASGFGLWHYVYFFGITNKVKSLSFDNESAVQVLAALSGDEHAEPVGDGCYAAPNGFGTFGGGAVADKLTHDLA